MGEYWLNLLRKFIPDTFKILRGFNVSEFEHFNINIRYYTLSVNLINIYLGDIRETVHGLISVKAERPVNNFSQVGTEPQFPVYNKPVFWKLEVSFSKTRDGVGRHRTQEFSLLSPVLYHRASFRRWYVTPLK